MRFPKDKAKILILSQDVNEGLKTNETTFPSPPYRTNQMDADLAAHEAKRAQIVAAEAAVRQLYEDEKPIFDRIEDGTKQNIKYGESVANGDDAILGLINWGNPSQPKPLEKPGQPRVLEIVGQGDGWVQIDWKEPVGGGKVASYIVRRSEDGGSKFDDATTVSISEATLLNQPKGKKLIYQVVAQNKAGDSMASNTVTLTL